MKVRIPWNELLETIITCVIALVVYVPLQYFLIGGAFGLPELQDAVIMPLIGVAAHFVVLLLYRFSDKANFVLKVVRREVLSKALAARNVVLGSRDQAEEARQLKEIAISVTYLKQVKYRHSRLRTILLLAAAAFYALVHVLDLGPIDNLVMAPLVLYLLLLLKEAVIEFRIKNGVFGTNAYEARAMIAFLLEHAETIDFTDDSGRPKRSLLPEKLSERAASLIPQEAKA